MTIISLRQRAGITGGSNIKSSSSILPQTHNHEENENTKIRRRRKKLAALPYHYWKRWRITKVALLLFCLSVAVITCLSAGIFFTVVYWIELLFHGNGEEKLLKQHHSSASAAAPQPKDTFVTPDLTPGQVSLLRWSNDNTIVQQYGARVGLPPQLIPTLTSYAQDMGLFDIMKNMLYENPLQPGDDARWFSFQSPYQTKNDNNKNEVMRNFTWNVERPDKHWKSDMHWFNTADELAHEDSLRALAKGGFDQVLEGIGTMFGLDTLHVDSLGFVAVTNCERGYMHHDWNDVDRRAFNFLVGIHSPDNAGAELYIENDEERRGEVQYGSNAGILVGDGTRHGTKECDHRSQHEVRITCSIYLADVTDDNLDILAADSTSIFPPTGASDWTWAQRGRHWDKNGGRSLVEDVGRRSYYVQDDEDGCERDMCLDAKDSNIGEYRNECLRTCNVFMDDRDYRPGESRREILGY
jgi:hypothetical protein